MTSNAVDRRRSVQGAAAAMGLGAVPGPIVFNETGGHPDASAAVLQVPDQKARVVRPRDVAGQRLVSPRPRA
jgi:hypothetical protein